MYIYFKGVCDFIFAIILVSILLPIALLIALLLLLAYGPRGIIFTQNRLGLKHKEFVLSKLNL